jgi:glucose-6-phosphate dehydrogenase assembly protein OpcA
MSSGIIAAQPEKILRALGQVWTSLGEEERQQGKPTVLRACAMTLIVMTDEEDAESANAAQTLVELMHAHPSRAIVVRSDKSAENGLSARVFAQCWKPFGKAQQICCEQIEVSAIPERWLDIGPTVLGIIVPDLPVVVWCRQQSVFRRATNENQQSGLDSVLALATKIIVDTSGADLDQAFSVLSQWKSKDRLFGDLEWTRLTAWRETLATVFEDQLTNRSSFNQVEIQYAGDAVPPSAHYLAAWLQRGLAAKQSFVRSTNADAEPGLVQVSIKSPDLAIELSRTGPTCLQLKVGEQQQRVSLAGSSLYELMHEELSVLGQDPVYESAFDRVGEIRS